MAIATATVNGNTFMLGRNKSIAYGPRLRLAKYLNTVEMPAPPESVSYTAAATKSLHNVYLNNKLGDCVIAMIWHIYGVLTANAGNEIVATDAQIVKDYSNIGGYNGNPRTDNGCDMQTANNWVLTKGYAGTTNKIEGWLSVDPKNLTECRAAVNLFEHLGLAAGVPNAWLNVPGEGFTWDRGGANGNNGHAFMIAGYNGGGFEVSTWGLLGTLTNSAMTHNIEEAYVYLDDAMIDKAKGRAPNGLDWYNLVKDFNDMGGNLPLPTPAPSVVLDLFV